MTLSFRNPSRTVFGRQWFWIFATRDQKHEELANCKIAQSLVTWFSNILYFSLAVAIMTFLNSHEKSESWLACVNCTFRTTAWQSSHRKSPIWNFTATSLYSRWKKILGSSRLSNNIFSVLVTFSNISRQKHTECKFNDLINNQRN